jgi:gliding motility-associated-like protein
MIGKLPQNTYFSTLNLKKLLQNPNIMHKYLKKSFLALFFLLPFLLTSNDAKATHVMGADITYKCIDTLKFEITIKYYRWCGGVSFGNPSSVSRIRCASGGQVGLNLTLDNIKEITPVCATASGECVPSNTWNTGEGIEQHTYKATIDFNRSPYSNLKNCCKIIIETGQCCRNSNITTGAANANFYTYAEVDICKAPCNSSPALTSEPIAILCCNQPFFFNNGASDTSDFDSLSYKWANPLSGWNQNIGYSGQYYAYNHPFAAYYPGSLTPPYKNANASPPIGITIDPETGDIIFTPTDCSEVTVAVIEVTEWRKDSTGKYEKVGVTRRDMQFIARSCPDNNPPIVNGPYEYKTCEGVQLCFNVTTDDKVFTPPPPATAPPPDTVTATWNRGIPGATFSIINPTARLQTGRFCWTPPKGSASDLPYTFTVTARDNACPLNAVTVRSFRVTVKHTAEANRNIDTFDCGKYFVESKTTAGFRGTPSYRWQILDSNLNIVFDNKIARFNSNGSFLSTRKSDTIQFRRGGFYIIQHTINNSPQNCPTTYYDTLVVPPLLEANLAIGQDTFICAGTNLRFEPYVSNYVNPLSYQWSTMGVTDDGDFLNNTVAMPGDTFDYFDLTVPSVQYDTAVSLFIKDGSGCTSEDTVQVFLKANPKAVLPPDPRLCTYDSILIIPNLDTAYWVDRELGDTLRQGDTLFKEWFYNGSSTPYSTADSVVINRRGEHVIKVTDSLGCWDTDTLYLFVNDTVDAYAGLDRTLCFNDTIFLEAQGLDTVGNGKSGIYRWYNLSSTPVSFLGTNTTYDIVAQSDVEYELRLDITEGGVTCNDSDYVFITVNPLPVINIRGDKDICCDFGNITLNFDVISPAGGTWTCPTNPNYVTNNVFYTDRACSTSTNSAYVHYTYQDPTTSCFNSDSLRITVNPLPTLMLRERDFCQDINQINLDDEVVLSPANTSLGTPSWKCLDCNGNDFNAMLEDRGPGAGITDYWLKVDPATYTLQNEDRDTITLEFEYVNENGCRSRDTVVLRLWKVPNITFAGSRDLCWDEGEISLNDLTGVNLTDGVWSVYDTTGFRAPSQLGGINGDTINTLNSVELANAGVTPNRFYLRYTHVATGCPTFNDTTLLINPLPNIILTDFTRQPPNFCESESDITLQANPSGGTWTSTDPSALVAGNTFSPGSANTIGAPIWFYYNYTNPATGCSNVDSLDALVEPLPQLDLPNDTTFCRPTGTMNGNLPFTVSAENNSFLSWFPANVFGNANRVSLSSPPSLQATLQYQNDSAETFRIIVAAGGQGSCSDIDDFFDITVNPRPDANIVPSNPNGCNPVTSDFEVIFNNNVDGATANYTWDLGEGSTSTSPTPTATYTTDGNNPLSVIVSSAAGCDTLLTSGIDVYPIPVAGFTPNPDNYTTAALPRFFFYNNSTVSNELGSTLTGYEWDFGDMNVTDDTAFTRDASYFYSNDTATYMVELKVETNFGCRDSFTYPVIVGPDLVVYIPNAFTPDNAGPTENEGFHAVISGELDMELVVFNRWGEIMFRTTDKTEKWDGTYKGAPAQQDVYAYKLKARSLNGEEYLYSGTVTLLR